MPKVWPRIWVAMTMLDRPKTRKDPAEDTVRLARKDFARRRLLQRVRRGRPLFLTLFGAVALAVGIWLLYFSSVVTVEEVEVTGLTNARASTVQDLGQVPLGTPLARVDLDAIRTRVETLPLVEAAEVSRAWPHGVHIAITERTPVAVINRGEGLQALDATGTLFRNFPRRPANLPLVRTNPGTKAEALAEAASVVTSLPADIALLVDFIEVTSVDRIKLQLKNGRTINWGSADDSAQKAEVLGVLLKQDAKKIDVSVPGRPTTTKG